MEDLRLGLREISSLRVNNLFHVEQFINIEWNNSLHIEYVPRETLCALKEEILKRYQCYYYVILLLIPLRKFNFFDFTGNYVGWNIIGEMFHVKPLVTFQSNCSHFSRYKFSILVISFCSLGDLSLYPHKCKAPWNITLNNSFSKVVLNLRALSFTVSILM